jgi:hypothetical protein
MLFVDDFDADPDPEILADCNWLFVTIDEGV